MSAYDPKRMHGVARMMHGMMYAAGRGHVMREFYSVFLPLGAVAFLLVYVFLINPDALHELGRWLQNSQFGRWLDNFF
jgi:hypothetical protein